MKSAMPTKKMKAAGLAWAFSILLVWALNRYLDAQLGVMEAQAITGLFSGLAGWMKAES